VHDGLGRPQTVVVLGGTSQIGVVIADTLLSAGGAVVLAGRDRAGLTRAAETIARPGRRVETMYYDAAAPAGAVVDLLAAAAPRIGDIDVVVLCVGVLTDEALIGRDTQAVEASLRSNMLGPMVAVHAAAQRLRIQGHGSLVVLSSVAAIRARAGLLTYGVAKSALDIYARRIGESLRGSGAGVVVIRPGHVRTPMTAGLSEPPFTTTAPQVAIRVRSALRAGSGVAYAPAVLRPVMSVLRLLPAAVFRRLNESRTVTRAAPRSLGCPRNKRMAEGEGRWT
jgi:decaprenylphospho-beta-D-erythro-pentofuranosid-2-ulose 2-reductase